VSDRKTQGIDATNQAFRRYDQVDKRQEYHLAEADHAEAFDEETRIPTCDIGRFLHGNEADKQALRPSWATRCAAWASPSSRVTGSTSRCTTKQTRGSSSCSPEPRWRKSCATAPAASGR
jgi:hypothetical protein